MNWTAKDIRQLRRRLGWSQAELARCVGCDNRTVGSWETGELSPESLFRQKLIRFHQNVEQRSMQIQRTPVAEILMERRRLSQIDGTELLHSPAMAHLTIVEDSKK